ncbi:MAG: hypothetical protein JXR37_12650 [Kiritimatiellae bacterium]|nr:hypothetical protein [Kiritimatiellia bacterium]
MRIGPLHSQLTFRQSAGFRYIAASGAGRADLNEDGVEFPLSSSLNLENYVVLTRYAGLGAGFSAEYSYYPMETQENVLSINAPQEGVYGDFSLDLAPGANLRARIYDTPSYLTDYVDFSGLSDEIAGLEYNRFDNTLGADIDWLMAPDKNLAVTLTRQDVVPEDEAFEDTGRTSYRADVSLEYQPNANLVVGPRANYSVQTFPSEERGDQTSTEANVFCRSRITRVISCSASIGLTSTRVASSDGGTDDGETRSVTADLSLEHILNRDTTHNFAFSRQLTSGFAAGTDLIDSYSYDITWRRSLGAVAFSTSLQSSQPETDTGGGYALLSSRLGLTRSLTRQLNVSLATDYTVRQNEDASDYNDWTTSFSTGLSLRPELSVRLTAQHQTRDSEDDEADRSEDRVELTFDYSHVF